ncbi:hypothetical protein NG821_09455 [Prevotella cerevisiae]|jgi:hypothetical protein|uniref:Uncharacterized protein n=1 Tax=Segatella cerevisiae TaxID=2053716 RepID=A0ABT1BZD1_9BACT|nr:hypothetical protein [Segatella cerevisiae]MCH3994217.1 hypothetical protein [Prevotella sp.]MCO6026060.1 hypothetical protein [Segatella cerevisiae]
MDKFSKELQDILIRLGQSPDLFTEQQEHYFKHLLQLLPVPDEVLLREYYGLFGTEVHPLDDLAYHRSINSEVMMSIIEKDLRRLAITPEWQQVLKPLIMGKTE